jgi:L-malate glycosyltransferase
MKKRILVICPYPPDTAAGQRLKYEQYIPQWKEAGYEVEISSFMSDKLWKVVYQKGHYITKLIETFKGYLKRRKDVRRAASFDLIYVFMYVTPFGNSLIEKQLFKQNPRVIFDLEDNRFVGANPEASGFIQRLRGIEKTEYLVKHAKHVITSSPDLNEYCLKINLDKKCTYITSSINLDRYQPRSTEKENETIHIGWTGTFSTRPFLDLLIPVFHALRKRMNYKLVVIGDFDYELPGIDVVSLRWKKETEIEDLQRIDIGVYPLPLHDWVMGKSGLKAIQYMAMQLPCVCTNVGTAKRFIQSGKNGVLVNTDEEWVDALYELAHNKTLREQMGRAGRKTVEENFSTKVVAQKYLDVLHKVVTFVE